MNLNQPSLPTPNKTFRAFLSILALVFSIGVPQTFAKKPTPPSPPPKVKHTPAVSSPLPTVSTPATATVTTLAAAAAVPAKPVDMKLLVITGNGTEPSYLALKAFLDQIGIPYVPVIAQTQPLPALNDSTKGFFQGIVLATGNLAICDGLGCRSALSAASWAALDAYAANFSVRTVSYYTFPEARYGLSFVSSVSTTDASPGFASFSPAAAAIFPYLNRANAMKISNAYTYLAAPVQAAGETTTPILSMGGLTVGATHKTADGRESLALTMDSNANLVHSLALNYGLFNWVTKGIFLGSRKVYLSPQVDDLFLPNDLFDARYPACIPVGFSADPTFDPADKCENRRIAGEDLDAVGYWQDAKNTKSQTSEFKIAMAFNGFGTTAAGGAPAGDYLTAAARSNGSQFFWVNHTYDHESLDCYDPAPNSSICTPANYNQSLDEIKKNVSVARTLGLSLEAKSMVTPAITGLQNPNFLKAAVNQGIRYLVSDASRPEGMPPSANTGIRNVFQPSILMIPRRATNIFYNTTTAFSGVGSETDEYNYFYGPNGIFRIGGPGGPPFFDQNQTYAQIVDNESNLLLLNMLRSEAFPIMFHQSNLWRYDGTRSLFTDVMDSTLQKFSQISNLPVNSLSQTATGQLLENRMAYNASGVRATLTPGIGITLTTTNGATVPVTGICVGSCDVYGGQNVSQIKLNAGSTVTVYPF